MKEKKAHSLGTLLKPIIFIMPVEDMKRVHTLCLETEIELLFSSNDQMFWFPSGYGGREEE